VTSVQTNLDIMTNKRGRRCLSCYCCYGVFHVSVRSASGSAHLHGRVVAVATSRWWCPYSASTLARVSAASRVQYGMGRRAHNLQLRRAGRGGGDAS